MDDFIEALARVELEADGQVAGVARFELGQRGAQIVLLAALLLPGELVGFDRRLDGGHVQLHLAVGVAAEDHDVAPGELHLLQLIVVMLHQFNFLLLGEGGEAVGGT